MPSCAGPVFRSRSFRVWARTWAKCSSDPKASVRWSSWGSRQRSTGRSLSGRHRSPAHARAGGAQLLGHLEFLAVGPFGPTHAKEVEYAKQRCTAYPRYVVRRRLVPVFLEAYLAVVNTIKFGDPLGWPNPDDPFPELDFGPVIHATKPAELRKQLDEAVSGGGIRLYRGSVGDGLFLDAQDASAYVAPSCVSSPRPHGHSIAQSPSAPWSPSSSLTPRPSWWRRWMCANELSTWPASRRQHGCSDTHLRELMVFKVGVDGTPQPRRPRRGLRGPRRRGWKGSFVGGDLLVKHPQRTDPTEASRRRTLREASQSWSRLAFALKPRRSESRAPGWLAVREVVDRLFRRPSRP